MRQRAFAGDEAVDTRLAVIEEKLETIIGELVSMKKIIPCTIVEHSERINVLGRSVRGIQWFGGVIAIALTGAFIGHVLGM